MSVVMRDLTGLEEEFIAEMNVEPGGPERWVHFDPPFLRKAYERFLRRGMLEYRYDGADREFRWTEKAENLLGQSK